MKKYSFFFALFVVIHLKSSAQAFLIPAGSGNNDATEISCDYYQLTPDISFEQGAIWYTHQLNLSNPFDYKFDIFLGTNNGVGADGMTFVIQNQSQALGPAGTFGSQLGYGTFPGKSLGVEFDTHNNGAGAPYGDIAQHHIAIDTGGVQFPPAAGPVTALASGANIDDGNWHTAEIVWTPATETMTVFFDGSQRLSCNFTAGLLSSVFGGQNMLYWGWTGASGSKFNTQQIRVPEQADFVSGINDSHCGTGNALIVDSSITGLNNITYLWNFDDGTTSTLQDPTHNFTTTGMHNVMLTITDGGGCTSDTTIAIDVRVLPVILTSQTNVTCFQANNGVARAAIAGGGPGTYVWAPAVSTVDSAVGLAPGTYAVLVTDQFGCSDTASVTITQPPILKDSVAKTNPLCFGDLTGSLTAMGSGGTPGYTYSWNPAVSTTASASGLPAGNYTSIVTDANGCTVSELVTIAQPPLLTDSFVVTNVLCFGDSTGSIIEIATGGAGGFTYTWSPSVSTTSSANNLQAGAYSSTVTDANGCSTSQHATITQPAALTATVADQNERCFGSSTGYIILASGGGVTPYSYNWTSGVSTTDSALNLTAGNYRVTLTDANGCTLIKSASITQPDSAVFVSAIATPVLCYGQTTGTITIEAGGGTPGYSYAISNAGNVTTSANNLFNNLAPATYEVIATDQNQCADSTSVTVNQPPQLVDSLGMLSPRCYHYLDGKVVVVASGGTPGPGYQYAFSNGINNTTGVSDNLGAGNYAVTVTDHSGCTITDSTVLTQPDSVLIDVTPTPVQVILGHQLQINTSSNQTLPVTYSWSPDFGLSCYDCSDPVFNGVYSQPYNVLATNQDSCFGTASFTVTVVPLYNIFFPNAFTPNQGGVNAYWQVFGETNAVKEIEVSVFDRIGEKVFESNDVDFKWDGTYKGKPAPQGVYTYMARIVWLNNYTEKLFEGSITLLH